MGFFFQLLPAQQWCFLPLSWAISSSSLFVPILSYSLPGDVAWVSGPWALWPFVQTDHGLRNKFPFLSFQPLPGPSLQLWALPGAENQVAFSPAGLWLSLCRLQSVKLCGSLLCSSPTFQPSLKPTIQPNRKLLSDRSQTLFAHSCTVSNWTCITSRWGHPLSPWPGAHLCTEMTTSCAYSPQNLAPPMQALEIPGRRDLSFLGFCLAPLLPGNLQHSVGALPWMGR